MISYKLENFIEELNKQVISMDQGLSYNPEFRASKEMHDYPSRKAQLIRSLYSKELEVSRYSAEMIYQSILSRQGERWQNFGESPEDYTDIMILGREMIYRSGIMNGELEKIIVKIADNYGHLLEIDETEFSECLNAIPQEVDSELYLFIDDQTAKFIPEALKKIGSYFAEKNIKFTPELEHHFPGWEYFAYGLIEQGKSHLAELFAELKEKNIKKIITLTGQSHYLLKYFADKLGMERNFNIINIIDILEELKTEQDVYLHAGSFYSRYLKYNEKINQLLAAETDSILPSSIEFLPLYSKGPRMNQVNIWQFPLTAEYELYLFPEEMREAIYRDGLRQIEKSIHKKLIVFDPYAYQVLKEDNYDKEFGYFTDLVKVW
jgi:hypothetical protein